MSCLPESFQMMADVLLVVNSVSLPAHKALLAANSTVFAELFTRQAPTTSNTKAGEPETLPQVPLTGETYEKSTSQLPIYTRTVTSALRQNQ